MYYSQSGEDKYLNDNIFKNRPKNGNENSSRQGVFLELGAVDGIEFSNTRFYEDVLGWTGYLIEAVPEFYQQLVHNRPKAKVFHGAVTTEFGQAEFLGKSPVSGLLATMSDGFYENWKKDGQLPDKSTAYLVKTFPLRSIINPEECPKIDLLSVDVEGGEYEVLKSFDWSIPVHVVLFEASNWDPQKNENCRILLREKGFTFHSGISGSEVWVNPLFED